MTLRERFETKYIPEPNSGCWLWIGGLVGKTGYGEIHCRPHGVLRAHRVAWELYHNPVPKGFYVLHRCDVPSCVNPDHLFLGTQLENMRDMRRKGRHIKAQKFISHEIKRPRSILTSTIASEIRELYAAGAGTQYELATQFGVTQTTISNIVSGKVWRIS